MPYDESTGKGVPDRVKGAKKRRQYAHVFNSTLKRTGSESRAHAAANSVVGRSKEVLQADKGYVGSWDTQMRQVPQDIADYDPFGASNGEGCATCQWFVSPDSCVLVSGDISPGGVSRFFTPQIKYETPPLDVRIVDIEFAESAEKQVETTPQPSLLARIGLAVKNFFNPVELPENPKPFLVFRDKEGALRFLVTYTNCFKDKHDEILTTESHKEYAEWVTKSGLYPQLQLWHCGEDSAIGQVDWVEFADGFGHASGIVHKQYEQVAQNIADSDNIGVSHGFIGVKKAPNSKLYEVYRTFEISPLLRDAAANIWMDTLISPTSKEFTMPFSDQKKAWLKSVGIPDETIVSWENNAKALGETLKNMNIEYREADEAEAPVSDADKPAEQSTAPATQAAPAVDVATKSELSFVVKSMSDMQTAIGGLAKSMQALTARVEQVAQPIEKQVENHFVAATSPAAVVANAHVASQSKDNISQEETRKKQVEDDLSWFDKEAFPFFTQQAGASK